MAIRLIIASEAVGAVRDVTATLTRLCAHAVIFEARKLDLTVVERTESLARVGGEFHLGVEDLLDWDLAEDLEVHEGQEL